MILTRGCSRSAGLQSGFRSPGHILTESTCNCFSDNMNAKSTLQGMNLDQIMPMLKGECSWGGRNRQQWGRLVLFYTLYFISIFGLFFLIVFLFHESTTAGSDGKFQPLSEHGGHGYRPGRSSVYHYT